MDAAPSALRHRQRRDVLGHPTHHRHLVKHLRSIQIRLIQLMKTKTLVTTIAASVRHRAPRLRRGRIHQHRHRHARQGEARTRRSRSARIRLTPSANFRRGRSSATRICTPVSRWMPARSAAGSTPRDAYRFARGEQVMASSGQPAKLSRPLDFLVVADHSDNMGFFPTCSPASPNCSPTRRAASGMT